MSEGTFIHNPPARAEKYDLPKDLHSGSLSGLYIAVRMILIERKN